MPVGAAQTVLLPIEVACGGGRGVGGGGGWVGGWVGGGGGGGAAK